LGTGLSVEGVAAGEKRGVLASVALIGGDEVQGAVAVGVVTLGDEATNSGNGPARGDRKATRVGGDPWRVESRVEPVIEAVVGVQNQVGGADSLAPVGTFEDPGSVVGGLGG